MSPIAGGVNIQPRVALNTDRVNIENADSINKLRDEVVLNNLAEGQWWWD